MPSEKRILQIVVSILAVTPVLAGAAGVLMGPALTGAGAPWPNDLDSHFRFLSAILLAIGLGWWSCVPGIETKTGRFQLLGALTFAGGLARLASLMLVGAPSAGHLFGLCVELLLVPPLLLWQRRVAREFR